MKGCAARRASVRRHDGDGAGCGIGWQDGGDAKVKVVGQGIGETGAGTVEENARRAREVGAGERHLRDGDTARSEELTVSPWPRKKPGLAKQKKINRVRRK